MTSPNPPRWQDRLGRVLTLLATLGAVLAFASSIPLVWAAPAATAWVETWRMLGLLVFAGMFALLTVRPRASPGIWELAFFHKAGMGLAGLFLAEAEDAASAGGTDAVLAAMIFFAYLLTRGWRSWQKAPTTKLSSF